MRVDDFRWGKLVKWKAAEQGGGSVVTRLVMVVVGDGVSSGV